MWDIISFAEIKNLGKAILCSKRMASIIINPTLRVHNLSYYLAGLLSQSLEPHRFHPKHRLIDYHSWFSSKLKSAWTILDVGCGNGALAKDLIKHSEHIIAIDNDPNKIRVAKNKSLGENIEFIIGDATTFPFKIHFDAIVLSNVLEHIKERISFLERLSHHSELLLIRVPMLDRDWITLYKKERKIPYMLDPGHYIEYTFDSFSMEINNAGLDIVDYRIRYGELYASCCKKNKD